MPGGTPGGTAAFATGAERVAVGHVPRRRSAGRAARRFWGGRSPIGKHFGAGDERVVVVGVVADGKYASLHEAPQPFLYRPFAQSYSPAATVHMRIPRGASAALSALRTGVRELDRALPLAATGTLEERLGASMLLQRTAALLLALFGLSGLALAAVGIYGSTAYWVSQRTREIGIQMALGASPRQVVRDILSQGVGLALGGAVLGLIVAGGASRLVSALLFGAKPVDPALFAAILLLIVAVGLVASTIPARRAASIAPAAALRSE
ncbi:MAG: FtsX-like permease family protein [Gemmatimonadetes bacterium]|nr:FtsX-like permease family protein [Gemmatimonadota bacterium]